MALLLMLAAKPTFASGRRDQEKAARKACLTGDYAKGVSILADLFVETREPVYIFNQARCYEQNRRYEDAIAQFEEFLRTPDSKLAPGDKAEAEKHIEQCKAKLPKERIEPAFAPVPLVPPPARPEPVPEPTPEPSATVAQSAAPAVGERRWGLVTAGIVASAVGAGGVAAGVFFNLKANDAGKKIETVAGAYPASSKDEKNYRRTAWIGYGAGAACLAAGVVLIAVGAVRSSPGSSTEVALVPAVGSGQVGAMLTGGF